MRCREHDTRLAKLNCFDKVGPTGEAPTTVPPRRRLLIEPTPIGEAAEVGEMWSTTPLALPFGTLEADATTQVAPMRRIKGAKLRSDRHGYAALFARTR